MEDGEVPSPPPGLESEQSVDPAAREPARAPASDLDPTLTVASPPPSALSGLVLGERLGGRFELVEELGQGGFGRVYLARDRELGREVAIKVIGLIGERSLSAEELELFDREAKATARLGHPNIVTIFDWGSWRGFPYLVLERLRGETLFVRLRRGPLAPDEAAGILLPVLRALAHAHAAGVLHLDLKPSNVFLGEGGEVKVLDFGMAQLDLARHSVRRALGKSPDEAAGSSPPAGGTPAYMAPEQWHGQGVDARADVWAVGVMLFEMLTGRLPFKVSARSSAALEPGPTPSVRALAPAVPAELEAIASRALAKDPTLRFQTARALLEALERFRRQSGPTHTKRRLVAFALALGGLAAIGVGAWLARSSTRRDPPPLSPPAYRQVTFRGDARDPSISPDGKWVAYAAGEQLLVQALGGGPARTLLSAKRLCCVRWVPNASEISFYASLEPAPTAAGLYGFYLISVFGGAPRPLPGFTGASDWAPEGERFADVRTARKRIFIQRKATGERSSIALSGSFTWLHEVDWSPTGDRLLFLTREGERYAVWTIGVDGRGQQKVFEESARLMSARWSPRADAIYFLRWRQDAAELLRVSVAPAGRAAGPVSSVLPGLLTASRISISNDGGRLIFMKEVKHSNLFVVDVSSAKPKARAITSDSSVKLRPSISPDGRRVAFSQGSSNRRNVFTIPLAGGQPTQLTFLDSDNLSPAWSPDGREIAFGSMEGGTARVWSVPSQGGPLRRFAGSRMSQSLRLTWAPGARILYHRPGNRNFHHLDPATGEERPLLRDDSRGWAFEPLYSPDGRSVALYWNRRDGPGLWIVSTKGGLERHLAKGLHVFPVGWSSDGKWVYFVQSGSRDELQLQKVAVEGGPPERVMTLPFDKPVWDVRMTPDAKQVVCSVVERQSDIWLVENFDPRSR
jgi:serine/threonine protein kinase/WD40 repeat protein